MIYCVSHHGFHDGETVVEREGGTDDLEQCGCTERGSYVDTCVGQDQTEKWWEKNVHAPHDMEKVRRSDGRCLPDFSSFFPVKWKNKMESNATEQEAVKDEFTAVPSLTLGVTCPRTQV